MNVADNLLINLRFADFLVPVRILSFRKMIQAEFQRMGELTKLPQLPLFIEEVPPKDSPDQIACFSYSGAIPKSFTFNIKSCHFFTIDEMLDTARHEWAHYLTHHRFGPGQGHNEKWKKICTDVVKCRPNPSKVAKKLSCIKLEAVCDEMNALKEDYLRVGRLSVCWDKALDKARTGDIECLRFCAILAYEHKMVALPVFLNKLSAVGDPESLFLEAFIRLMNGDRKQLPKIKKTGEKGCVLANFLYGFWLSEGYYGLEKNLRKGLIYVGEAMKCHFIPAMAYFAEKMCIREDFAATAELIKLDIGITDDPSRLSYKSRAFLQCI